MKGQLGSINQIESPDDIEPEPETWSEDMLRKRSEELQILDFQGIKIEIRRNESRCEELTLSDQDQSPSRSTTTESQVIILHINQRSICITFEAIALLFLRYHRLSR